MHGLAHINAREGLMYRTEIWKNLIFRRVRHGEEKGYCSRWLLPKAHLSQNERNNVDDALRR